MPVLDIYIGGLIEHDSDRAVLKTVVTLLAGDLRSAVVLANLHFAGRQIDLVVGLPDKTLVIEAKSYRVGARRNERSLGGASCIRRLEADRQSLPTDAGCETRAAGRHERLLARACRVSRSSIGVLSNSPISPWRDFNATCLITVPMV
ncbi:NERD domain-containing protein [Mesorhizobium sp. M0317]|uniref:hypothetical protein n=1 Tax=Mesorhizobium sp. M0317 TaxID=2956935 RepID=UPI00333C1958